MISLVTGVGAKGQVGEAVAAALAARGDAVIIVARTQAEADARAVELAKDGTKVRGFACDLTNPTDVERVAVAIKAESGGRLDALVNLAGGFGSTGPVAGADPAAFKRMLDINLTTAFLATRAFYPLVQTARGSIVFFASESVIEGARTGGTSAYAAAKSAVVALMRSVADEGRDAGVRANAVAPAAIRTATNEASMPPTTRYVEREDVAAAVAFLSSPAARAITGQVIRLR